MTGRVRELSSTTVERIAAGEVVTRPARAVAELLDNALDAGADRVEVGVEGGGRTLTVRDDGRGLSPADARRAVHPHTTSKLPPDGEPSRVDSLGFRGEALASVADAAGELELLTNDGDDGAVRVSVTGTAGDLAVETAPASRARGTTVTVRDLFADRPARRESLDDARREFGRVSRLVARYALLSPGTAIRLTHDGRETLSTPGTGTRDALLAVYDRETARAATAVEFETTLPSVDGTGETEGDDSEATDGEGATLTVDGLVCDPSVTRSDGRAVHVGVRGRPVDDDRLRRAVVDGYGRLLAEGDAPVAVVRLSLPAAAVDPNVHPAKRRVALQAGETVRDGVRTAVSEALSTTDLTRTAETATDVETALAPETGDSVLADATYLGQFDDLYLLCEADDDLLVVDQHAAHERVNFERLRAAVGDDLPSRAVSPPATLSVDPTVASAVEEHGDRLSALGFDATSLGGGTVTVRAVPAPLGRTAAPASLRETAAALARGESPTPRADLLADLACHPSLKAGDELDDETARDLLARLAECDSPFACPHGRPTVLSVASSTLARGFDRDGRR
ncbi:DNA mismatch repair endonuclease MutL [Halobaculum sp. MBLA0143]|uniref:DNA mismatch repair endonuclease MutL n=1 Tax=Halobaculum sp. MBLA0143 TaxID=3079933 RepID=UPI003525A53B